MIRTLLKTNAPLTLSAILLLLALPASLAGVWLDPRIITGVPAWLKPAKFALSTSVYLFTLAWIFRYLPDWPRLRSAVGWVSSLVMLAEVALIDLQAYRGTSSHFNVATPFDSAVYFAMGIGIGTAWIASIALAIALFRQKFSDPVIGWALRLGMLITVLGAATGGLMTQPTAAQIAELKATQNLRVAGAHTVGAPDGGPGIPVTGWSKQHGDLRVPHFLGLHAIQILPLIAFAWRPQKARAIFAAGTIYALLFFLTLVQALAGMPVLGGHL